MDDWNNLNSLNNLDKDKDDADLVEVFVLGKFDITVGDVSILEYLPGASKSILLLKYLILNRRKAVPIHTLIDVFWSEKNIANPENALKTMVSRIRSNLAQAHPLFKNCIIAEKGAYRWNPSIETLVDATQFEELCNRLLEETTFSDAAQNDYMKILALYQGDLSPTSGEEWLASQSMYYHNLYLKAVHHFIEQLKAKEDYETILYVCRVAIDIDPFDEELNLELMTALKQLDRNSVALAQYHHITGMYNKFLGVDPGERMINFYRELIRSDMDAKNEIESIRENLEEEEPLSGAFVCDFSVFKDICQLLFRNLERTDTDMYLVLISVDNRVEEQFDPFVLEAIMQNLQEILISCLRKGDSISRYTATQYAVLLPMKSRSGRMTVFERIKKMFYQKHVESHIALTFQIELINKPKLHK